MATETTTTYNITSLYSFSEPAKIEIREKFYKSLGATNVRLDHDQGDLFTLTCPKEDKTSFLTFFNLMTQSISSELESQPEVFEDTKVKRMADTQTETNDTQEEIISVENARQTDQEMSSEAQCAESSILLIPHESFSRTWSSKFSESHRGAEVKIKERLLGIIGTLTSCRVELEYDRKAVTVKGEDIGQVRKAILKLDVVDRCINQQSTCPRKYDFQYAEGELDIMLLLKKLKDVEDRRLQTTLIPHEPSLRKRFANDLTVIMVNMVNNECIEMLVTPSGRPSPASLNLWKDHSFKPLGDERKVDFTPSSSSVSSTYPASATVGRWVEQSASEVLDNPFSPPDLTKENSRSIEEVTVQPQIEPPLPPPPVRKRHVKNRKPLGVKVPIAKDLPPSAVANPHEIPDIQENDALSQAIPASFKMDAASKAGSRPVVANERNERNIKPPPIEPPYMPKPSLMRTELPPDPTEPLIMLSDSPVIPKEPPFMPMESKSSSQGDYQRKIPIWDSKRVEYSPVGKLIDLSSPTQEIQDRVKNADEVDTRRLKQTMNQKKSASHLGASKSSFAAFLKDSKKATIDILDLARVSQGPVTLRVEIGRILINHLSGSRDFKGKRFAIGDWPKVFPMDGVSKLETRFTNMLTSSASDAHSILGLVLPSGRPMITAEPDERKITYRFDCWTKYDDRVIVEVDENGNPEIRCNEFEIGSLNYHFPKRYWDARLAVNSSERLSNDIRNAAQELVDNLRIRPSLDRKGFNMCTKIEKGDLRIESILLRRETCHHVPEYRDIIFHLAEVQALHRPRPSDSKSKYEASLPAPQTNASGSWCKLWWEVALSSISATKRLKEIDGLELGEEATWTAHNVLREDVVEDLSYVTRDLVERIDYVGFSNKGPRAGSGTKSSEKDKPDW